MGSLKNNSKAPYHDEQDVKTAWAELLRRLKTSGQSVHEFCQNNTLTLDTGVEMKVAPHQVYYARKNADKDGCYSDGRHNNPGRPVELSGYCQGLLLESFINFPKWTAKAHHAIMLECIAYDPRLKQHKVATARKPSYRQAKRFIKSLPLLIKTYAEGGIKAVREKLGPCPLPPNYVPGQLMVADTVTLKELEFLKDGKRQHPQVTFLMDAASQYCVWLVVHWENATSEIFMTLLQEGLARKYCPKKSDLWIKVGCPAMLLTDNGPIFKNKDVRRFCHKLDIEKEFSYPYCANNNGLAETFSKQVTCGFAPHLVKLALDWGLAKENGVSERTQMFLNKLYELVEKYNQTSKPCLGNLSPIEYFERNRPHAGFNPRSDEEIKKASRVYTHVMVSRGNFTYNEAQYHCDGLDYVVGRFKIWVDPCVHHPTKIEVEHKGKIIGTATNKHLDASALTHRPTRSRGVRIIVPGVRKYPKSLGKPENKSSSTTKVTVATVTTLPELPVVTSSPTAFKLSSLPVWAKEEN